jgi:hypothetical protein
MTHRKALKKPQAVSIVAVRVARNRLLLAPAAVCDLVRMKPRLGHNMLQLNRATACYLHNIHGPTRSLASTAPILQAQTKFLGICMKSPPISYQLGRILCTEKPPAQTSLSAKCYDVPSSLYSDVPNSCQAMVITATDIPRHAVIIYSCSIDNQWVIAMRLDQYESYKGHVASNQKAVSSVATV